MITKDEQMIVWNTKVIEAFNHLNFDMMLFAKDIKGTETYINKGDKKNPCHVEGYEVHKKHKNKKVSTVYFVRSKDADKLPLLLHEKSCEKVHYNKKIYYLVNSATPFNIEPEKIFNWDELISLSGIPLHTNHIQYRLYKNKVLFGKTYEQFYYRVVTESAFGKDKYKESVNLLLEGGVIISDPTIAKLFYSVSHNDDVTINELPDTSNKSDFIKMCNAFMRIGDGTKILQNRARSTNGTEEEAHIQRLTVSFIHNIPEYYRSKGLKHFDEIFPFNVVSRYYYCQYDGFLQFKKPHNLNPSKEAEKYSSFIRNWIKSVLWYKENWEQIKNPYPEILLDKFVFPRNLPRFKDMFKDFAKCLSQDAKDINEYLLLLKEEYQCYSKLFNELNRPKVEIFNREFNEVDLSAKQHS